MVINLKGADRINTLKVYPTWQTVDNRKLENTIAVVIDVLRASNTIITAFKNKAKEIIPVTEIKEAWDFKKKHPDYLLGGERNSIKIEGFDFGNSPLEYVKNKVFNKTIVLSTSNGSKALIKVNQAEHIFIASFQNIKAVSKKLISLNKNIVIVCAGTLNTPSLEDTLAAGKIVYYLEKLNKNYIYNDYAYLALGSYLHYRRDIYQTILNSRNGQRLQSLGKLDDIKFCTLEETTNIIPEYRRNRIFIEKALPF